MRNPVVFYLLILSAMLSSCEPGIKRGADISANHISYIKSLGLLSEGEHIILFDAQYKIRKSGNFFTNKRIAAYWIDDKNGKKSAVHSAYYREIDSVKSRFDPTRGSVFSSFLEVYPRGMEKFRVYVWADSAETRYFFEQAIAEWKKNRQ
ncbi:MAG TPA: hypothetical protein VHA56_07830 [Mucilaginibacter sp.]|nr:hypothetical protein [Mucilaginibacter sp.]